jgi:hypothetical protein
VWVCPGIDWHACVSKTTPHTTSGWRQSSFDLYTTQTCHTENTLLKFQWLRLTFLLLQGPENHVRSWLDHSSSKFKKKKKENYLIFHVLHISKNKRHVYHLTTVPPSWHPTESSHFKEEAYLASRCYSPTKIINWT